MEFLKPETALFVWTMFSLIAFCFLIYVAVLVVRKYLRK